MHRLHIWAILGMWILNYSMQFFGLGLGLGLGLGFTLHTVNLAKNCIE